MKSDSRFHHLVSTVVTPSRYLVSCDHEKIQHLFPNLKNPEIPMKKYAENWARRVA